MKKRKIFLFHLLLPPPGGNSPVRPPPVFKPFVDADLMAATTNPPSIFFYVVHLQW